MKTNDDWQWSSDFYDLAYATTDDPRVVTVIRRDEDHRISELLDGDVIVPIYSIEYIGQYRATHQGGFDDDEFAARLLDARSRFQYAAGYRYSGLSYDMIAKSMKMMRRWARVFHDAVFTFFTHGGDEWVVFSNDVFQRHVGEKFDREKEERVVAATVEEVENVLDGNVYGIGYAVNTGRVLGDDEPIDLDDPNWVTDIECWGFIGEEYAKGEAADFAAGEPMLDPMLEMPSLHEPDHTDRMAEMSILDARLNEN